MFACFSYRLKKPKHNLFPPLILPFFFLPFFRYEYGELKKKKFIVVFQVSDGKDKIKNKENISCKIVAIFFCVFFFLSVVKQ